MTQKHTAANSRSQTVRKESAGLSSARRNQNRITTNKWKSCADDSSRNVNPELKVKDFTSYYLSGPEECFDPKYSVTSHAAPCTARSRGACSPTCSYRNDVQLNTCLQPTVASTYNCQPGYTELSYTSKRKLCKGNINKRTNADATIGNIKSCKKSSCSSLKDPTTPNFSGSYRRRCYYEAYQISNTDLSKKKGVKFFNDDREEETSRTSSRNTMDCRTISRDRIHKPMHLVEEAGSYCPRTIEHRKPIPSWSIKSFDVARRPKSCENGNGRVARVKNYRRILYNEGIADDLVGLRSVSQLRPPSPAPARRHSAKDWTCDDVIPCSYISKSKYHYHCQEEVSKKCYKHAGNERAGGACAGAATPEQVPLILYRAPSIKLPKEVLACIRGIDGKTIL